jgi:acyl carrier protein
MRDELTAAVLACVRQAEPRVSGETREDESLVESGLLDSVAIFNLLNELETRFHVEILDEELDVQNFETVALIARLVGSKLTDAPLEEIAGRQLPSSTGLR